MNKVIQERAVMPANLYYDTVFAKKYLENGRPGNLYRNYVPPLHSARLRDFKGNVLRRNAEKTPALCEFFLDLMTKKDALVVDPFAGTCSMGLACIKSDRKYFGTELDMSVHSFAFTRLMKFAFMKSRGDLSHEAKPGASPSIMAQACGAFRATTCQLGRTLSKESWRKTLI